MQRINQRLERQSSRMYPIRFNTSLTSMDRYYRQKVSKEIVVLNDLLDQMDLTDIFKVILPKAAECTFFSRALGTFSRIDHM